MVAPSNTHPHKQLLCNYSAPPATKCKSAQSHQSAQAWTWHSCKVKRKCLIEDRLNKCSTSGRCSIHQHGQASLKLHGQHIAAGKTCGFNRKSTEHNSHVGICSCKSIVRCCWSSRVPTRAHKCPRAIRATLHGCCFYGCKVQEKGIACNSSAGIVLVAGTNGHK